jgi:hypothetical protein
VVGVVSPYTADLWKESLSPGTFASRILRVMELISCHLPTSRAVCTWYWYIVMVTTLL